MDKVMDRFWPGFRYGYLCTGPSRSECPDTRYHAEWQLLRVYRNIKDDAQALFWSSRSIQLERLARINSKLSKRYTYAAHVQQGFGIDELYTRSSWAIIANNLRELRMHWDEIDSLRDYQRLMHSDRTVPLTLSDRIQAFVDDVPDLDAFVFQKQATSITKHRKDERVEFEFHHNLWARHWHEALLNARPPKEAKMGQPKSKASIPNVTMFGRRFAITTTSVLQARLELRTLGLNRNTLVNELKGYRSKNHDVDWFISIMKKPGDLPTITHLEKLKFLFWDSPKLRNVFLEVKRTILNPEDTLDPRPRKSLATSDTPLPAWFYELRLRFLGIDARVIHSGLNDMAATDYTICMVSSLNESQALAP